MKTKEKKKEKHASANGNGDTHPESHPDALGIHHGDLRAECRKIRNKVYLKELARMQIAFYGSTPNYGFIFDQIGYEGTTEKIRHHQKAGAIGEMAGVITDDILDHFVVTATWSELGRKLVERYGGRADRVVAYFSAATWTSDHDAFARWAEVTAAFKAAQLQ